MKQLIITATARILPALALALLMMPASAQVPGLDQALDDTIQSITERQAEQIQEKTLEQANQSAERAVEQAVERSVNQADEQAERVQEMVLDRAQGEAERVQIQAERIRNQADRVQNQAERVQNQAERAQSQAERARRQSDRLAELPQAAQEALERLGLLAPDRVRPTPELPERLPIVDRIGDTAFVEVVVEPDVRALDREWIMMLSQTEYSRLEQESPELMAFLVNSETFTGIGSVLLTFKVSPDLDAGEAVRNLVPDDLRDRIDRNHVYSPQSAPGRVLEEGLIEGGLIEDRSVKRGREPEHGFTVAPLTLPMSPVCEAPVSVGMIDSAVFSDHEAFSANRASTLVTQSFVSEKIEQPTGHGTAVAGILIGQGPDLQPLLPRATVYGASVVYSRDAYNQGASVTDILQGLDWLISQQVDVINISMTGPDNRLLERAIQAALANGSLIVAAAGNEGPHAKPMYPAAYDGVIAVTAVDAEQSVYRWAAQGDYIDFAALGVSVPTAFGDGSFGRESGTSMAAPVVAGFLACEAFARRDGGAALSALVHYARDLGNPGRDPVFGYGLLHPGT